VADNNCQIKEIILTNLTNIVYFIKVFNENFDFIDNSFQLNFVKLFRTEIFFN